MNTPKSPTINAPPPQSKSVIGAKHKTVLWIIAVLTLLAAVLAVWSWQRSQPLQPVLPSPAAVKEGLPQGYEFQALPPGQYPAGFPQELALSVGPKEVIRAEDTKVASGQRQKIVDIRTTDRPDSLAGLYRNTLTDPKQGWQLIDSHTTNDITVLTFNKAAATLIVTILPQAAGSQMNLTYISQP